MPQPASDMPAGAKLRVIIGHFASDIRHTRHSSRWPLRGSIVLARSCWLDRADDAELSAIGRQTVAWGNVTAGPNWARSSRLRELEPAGRQR
jgi:hypothetical protein